MTVSRGDRRDQRQQPNAFTASSSTAPRSSCSQAGGQGQQPDLIASWALKAAQICCGRGGRATARGGRSPPEGRADVALELLVTSGVDVADDGVGDVSVDVEGAVPAGQYAEHSSPAIVRHGKAALEKPRVSARCRATGRAVAPPEGVGGGDRERVREHRQDEGLGVPERRQPADRAIPSAFALSWPAAAVMAAYLAPITA